MTFPARPPTTDSVEQEAEAFVGGMAIEDHGVVEAHLPQGVQALDGRRQVARDGDVGDDGAPAAGVTESGEGVGQCLVVVVGGRGDPAVGVERGPRDELSPPGGEEESHSCRPRREVGAAVGTVVSSRRRRGHSSMNVRKRASKSAPTAWKSSRVDPGPMPNSRRPAER